MPSNAIYRSSSLEGFSTLINIKPAQSQVASWARKHDAADSNQVKVKKIQCESVTKKPKGPAEKPQENKILIAEQREKNKISGVSLQNNENAKKPKTTAERSRPDQSERVVFTLGSPVGEVKQHDKEAENVGFGKFLEVCAVCKKSIGDEYAFMYGYLQAFCSPECRDYQIALDERFRMPSPESKGAETKSVGNSAIPLF